MIQLELTIRKYRNGDTLYVTDQILSEISITYGVSRVPTLTLTLPLDCNDIVTKYRCEIQLSIGCINFCGLVNSNSIRYLDGKIELQCEHIISEFKYSYIQENLAIKQKQIDYLYTNEDFGRDLWNILFTNNTNTYLVEYLFSNQDKLSAISDIIKQFPTLEWRIPIDNGCRTFEYFDYTQNTKTTHILDERKLYSVSKFVKWDNVVNQVRVTAGNVGNGTGQMTLRHFLLNPTLQDPNFPVTISSKTPNTDEIYNPIHDDIKTGSNDDFEYLCTDIQSLSDENGEIYQGRLNLNDFYPIADQGQIITDADRAIMYQKIYDTTKRWLRLKRRNVTYTVEYAELPCDLQVGDKVSLSFENKKVTMNACDMGSSVECTLSENLEMYIVERTVSYDMNGAERNTLLLATNLTDFRAIQSNPIGEVVTIVAKQENVTRQKEEQRKAETHTKNYEGQGMFGVGTDYEVEFELPKDLVFHYSWTLRYRIIPVKVTLDSGGISVSSMLSPNPLPNHTLTIADHSIPADPHGNLIINHDTTGTDLTHPAQTIVNTVFTTATVASTPITLDNIRVYFDNVDFTAQLQSQFPGDWATPGNNYQNSNWIPIGGDINDKFDIIEGAKVMGNFDTLGEAGKHRIKWTAGTGIGEVEWRLELQISHLSR